MKKLYLVRHAKSSWKHEGLKDMDRPLHGRGVNDAHSGSQWLSEQGEIPNHIVSSPATRALHTALIFAKNFDITIKEVEVNNEIYHSGTNELLKVVSKFDDKYESVMLFGHNPTITDFVNRCIDHRIDNVPTTGIACLKFNVGSWKDIDKKAELVFFDYPKRRNKA